MQNQLTYIEVERLFPHPDNPRKDLGDLSELASSIAQSGVMQNLTAVVRDAEKGEYTVIIGHRRLAASKLAGLKSVPCVVVEMSDKEQLATMMLENMQRSDLTIYEQAQGFQMMMDLGETVETIAEKTGISKSTVRNRMKLTRYDAAIMREAALRQPTMEQYMKLSDIEDVSIANDVARFLGTKNFDNEVAKAIRQQNEVKERKKLDDLISSFAEKLEDASWQTVENLGLVSVASFYTPLTPENEEKAKKLAADGTKYYYGVGYGYTVYRKKSAEDLAAIEEAKEKNRLKEEFQRKADDIYQGIVERADEFVANYKGTGKLDNAILHAYLVRFCMLGKLASLNRHDIATALGWEEPEEYCSWEDEWKNVVNEYILWSYEHGENKALLNILYHGTDHDEICYIPYGKKKFERYKNRADTLLETLMLLEELGYNVAQEEYEFCSGKHPIYNEEGTW